MPENSAGFPMSALPCYACKQSAVVQMDGVMTCLACGSPWYTHKQANNLAQEWATNKTVIEHKVIHAEFRKGRTP